MGPIFLLLVLALSVCRALEDNKRVLCPSEESIKPCTCGERQTGKPVVTCIGVDSADRLREALRALVGYQLSYFYLEESKIGVLPADIFRKIEIEAIFMENTELTDLSEGPNRPPFSGLERSLRLISIYNYFLTKDTPFTSFSLSHLKQLKILELGRYKIPMIGNDWFENGPYGIQDVYFIDSQTQKIGSSAFAFLKDLTKIAVTGGSVSLVTRDMFPRPALRLQVIELSRNALSSLPEDMFTSMPSLKIVNLRDNALERIGEIVWAPVWSNLTTFWLQGNPIECDDNVRWMYKHRLPRYFFGHCASPDNMKGKRLSKVKLEDLK